MTSDPDVPQVTVTEARSLMTAGAALIDVREPDEWDAGHAPEATLIPLGDLQSMADSLDRQRRIVVVCRSGRRSDLAAAQLNRDGFDACNLIGGMQAWAAAGGDVVTATNQPGTVI